MIASVHPKVSDLKPSCFAVSCNKVFLGFVNIFLWCLMPCLSPGRPTKGVSLVSGPLFVEECLHSNIFSWRRAGSGHCTRLKWLGSVDFLLIIIIIIIVVVVVVIIVVMVKMIVKVLILFVKGSAFCHYILF